MSAAIMSFIGGAVATGAAPVANPITTAIGYAANSSMPIVMPDMPELIGSFMSGEMSSPQFIELALMHGRKYIHTGELFTYTMPVLGVASLDQDALDRPRNIHDKVLQQHRFLPSFVEANQLFNRGLIAEDVYNFIGNQHATFNPALAEAYRKLRFEIPGPADLVRFAVRDVFSAEIVSRFEYGKETPSQIKPWMEKQGYGQEIGMALPENATDENNAPIGGTATWFDMYWQSHWDLPSPTQGYEMLHRLYPTSRYGPSPFATATSGFTTADLSLLLKASDYPSFWRERLMAISYHNLNRSDVLPMYRFGLVNRETVYHALRADGYRDEEAMQLVTLAEFQKQRELGVDPAKKAKTWICKAYQDGMITRDNAISRLEEIGITRRFADSFLDMCDLEALFELNKERISTLKRGVITGVVTAQGADNLLNRMNIEPRVIARYLEVWDHLKLSRYKSASTRQNIKAYSTGIINRNEVIARLQNLMYTSVAISTMIGMADYEIGQRNLKRIQAETRARSIEARARAKEVLAAQKLAKANQKKVETNIDKFNNRRIRSIIKSSSDANILAWYKKEFIDLWEVFYRLYHKDYSIADANHWVRNKIPDQPESEIINAEAKGKRIYRGEPNPPLE